MNPVEIKEMIHFKIMILCPKYVSTISKNVLKNGKYIFKVYLYHQVHEMDLLPKHMCHRCSYKLEEFHKFYIDCLKTDTTLKNQLSWMRKDTPKATVGPPMVHIENFKVKSELHEMVPLLESVGLVDFPVTDVQSGLPDCIMYSSFANTSHCQCYCDKADPKCQAIPKDCTHSELDLRKRSNLPFHLNGTKKPQEPEILWKKRKNLFGFSEDPQKVLERSEKSQVDPLFAKSTLSKPGSLSRKLRPRKRSVDYVGTKRKNPASDSSETTSKSFEPNPQIISDVQVKVEIDEKPLRSLRPRKQVEAEGKNKKNRSKSLEYSRKRIKTPKSSRRNSLSVEALELKIKREIVDSVDNVGIERLDLKSEPLEVPNSGRLSVENLSSLFKRKKEGFRSGKTFKRSRRVQFSPKNLRSQDLHLRNGKVKVKDDLSPQILRRDLKSGNLELKRLCEKCNLSFANKELFRLHACYSN